MNFNLVKKVYNNLPYFFKAPFSFLIRNKLIKNRIFLEQYRILCENDMKTEEEKRQEQLSALKDILLYASEHSEFYRELFEKNMFDPQQINDISDLSKLPILSKKDLKENIDRIVTDDIDDFYTVTTGGTTGAQTTVLMANEALFKEWAFVYHFWQKKGYDYNKSKLATFRGVALGNKICEINPLYREIRMNTFLLNRNNVRKYIKKIENYKADFLYGYPSAIYSFCKFIKQENINIQKKFKAVFLISENLYSFQEKVIKEVLGCPIGIFYGHSERAVFAECGEEGYCFNSAYGVTEISNEGEPIVTGFINRKTPLVRYKVDDLVKHKGNGVYEIVGHHESDILYGINGEEISMAAVNFHDGTFAKVEAYQFIQNAYGKCELHIKVMEDFSEQEMLSIKKAVQNKLGKALVCYISIVSDLILSNRGKYKMVIQNMESINDEKA